MENSDLHIILRRHVSHDVRIASYGDPRPVVQLVCFTCDKVVMSADQPSDPDKRPRRDLIGGSLVETTRGTATLLAYIAEPSSPTGRTLLVRLVDGGEEFETTIDDLLTRDRRKIT